MRTNYLTTALTSVVFCFLCAATASADWASLSGQFVFGPPGTDLPKQIKLAPNKDVEVCGKEALFNESLVVNPKNRGLANVVIWAYKPGEVHPKYESTMPKKVTVANAACRFEPHVLTLSTTQTLEVANPDPVAHNAMITFIKNQPLNPLIPALGKINLQLKKAEIIPVTISCSIHPWMQGKILVQDHPYMAVTDKDGKFHLQDLPAGKLTLKVWHEKIGYVRGVAVDGKATKWNKGKYQLALAPDKHAKHVYQVDPKLFAKK